jgi:hypothetical protein
MGVLPELTQAQTYELPEYDDARRWNRAATLLTAVLVSDIAKSKARGVTAAEAGAEAAGIFGPPNGWTGSDTPFVLFRGMYYNWMTHPEQTCELLEAGEDVVRARCNRPYLSYFGESGESYGVTVADYEASSKTFAWTIADYHGMDWEQQHDGDDLLITIRKR